MFNYKSSIYDAQAVKTINWLFMNKHFSDVTLACDYGHQVKAHKAVLSSCSSVFQSILVNNPNPSPIIFIKDTRPEHLNNLVQYIYTGSVQVYKESLSDFISLAKNFQIEGLDDHLNEHEEESNHVKEEGGTTNGVILDETQLMEDVEDSTNETKAVHATKESNSEDLIIDKNYFKEPGGRNYYCQHCDYVTKHRKQMENHNMCVHEKVKFDCDSCYKVFSDPSSLRRHKRSKHEGVRFPCDQCDLFPTTAFDLAKHKRVKHGL